LVLVASFCVRGEEPPAPPPEDAPSRLPGVKSDCPECLGQGVVPLLPYKARICTAGEDAPKLERPAAWKFCPQCLPDRDASEAAQLEARWRDGARARKQEWEQLTGAKLLLVTTPCVSLHSTLPAKETQRLAAILEQLAAHLQEATRSTLLTPTRPDRDELVLVGDDKVYNQIIDALAKKAPSENWELTRKASGGADWHLGFSHTGRIGQTTGNHVLFMLGQMIMYEATQKKAKPWLVEGFAAYCENAVTHRNYYYSFAYEPNQTRLGDNWDQEMRRCVQKGQLKNWEFIFPISVVGLKAVDYLECYSIVSYLLKTDPVRFAKVVQLVRDGQESAPAIEAAYGKRISELQADWKAWVMRLGVPGR
jgi:hypothetical protein